MHLKIHEISNIVQIESIRTLCPPGVFLGLGVLRHFGLKSKARKIVKIYKEFEV